MINSVVWNTYRSHSLDELDVVSNLAILALEGVGSVAEGGQGLLAGAQRQGNGLQGRHNNSKNRSGQHPAALAEGEGAGQVG